MVDYFCWPWVERFPLFKNFLQVNLLPVERFAKLLAWQAEMEKTPGVKATRISPEDFLEFFKENKSQDCDYDFALKK